MWSFRLCMEITITIPGCTVSDKKDGKKAALCEFTAVPFYEKVRTNADRETLQWKKSYWCT